MRRATGERFRPHAKTSPKPKPTRQTLMRRAASHVTRKVPPYVVEVRLGFVQDGVDVVVLAPLQGRLPPRQGVPFVPAERPDVSSGHLVLALPRHRHRAIHRLGGLDGHDRRRRMRFVGEWCQYWFCFVLCVAFDRPALPLPGSRLCLLGTYLSPVLFAILNVLLICVARWVRPPLERLRRRLRFKLGRGGNPVLVQVSEIRGTQCSLARCYRAAQRMRRSYS